MASRQQVQVPRIGVEVAQGLISVYTVE